MEEYRRVELIRECSEYKKLGLKIGDQGIVLGEERNGYVLVYFDGEIYQNEDGIYFTTEIDAGIKPDDLKVIN